MRKRSAFLWTLLVLCLALLLPAATVAGSRYKAVVLYDECTLVGGINGFGWAELTVRAKEVRRSGVNSFNFKSELQELSNGQWTRYMWWDDETSLWFPNNRANHYHTIDRYIDFNSNATMYYHRIVITIEYWSTWDLISSKTVIGTSC